MWQNLVKTALLGTARSQLPAETLAQLEQQGIDISSNSTQIVLESAAVLGQMRKAGWVLEYYEGNLPEPRITEAEHFCGQRAAKHLKEILEGPYRKLLPEFIFLAAKAQRIILPEYLPALFGACARNKPLWKTAEPIIGSHGRWLLQQNPVWKKFEKWSADTAILPLSESAIYPVVKDPYRLTEDNILNARPELFNELRSLLQQNSSPVYENYIRQLLQMLFFREEMIKSFSI